MSVDKCLSCEKKKLQEDYTLNKYDQLYNRIARQYGESYFQTIQHKRANIEDLIGPFLQKAGGTVDGFIDYAKKRTIKASTDTLVGSPTLAEMSGTGGAAFTIPGTGMGVATKKAFKKPKVRKPKHFQLSKNKNKPFNTKLSSMLYEIKPQVENTGIKKRFIEVFLEDSDSVYQQVLRGEIHVPTDPEEFKKIILDLANQNINEETIRDAWSWMIKLLMNGGDDYGADWDAFDWTANYVMTGDEKSLYESISYNQFKSQSKTKNNSAAFHSAVKEIKRRLSEVNRILEYTNKMRGELSEDKALKYTKYTEAALSQLSTMVAEVYGKLKNLKK